MYTIIILPMYPNSEIRFSYVSFIKSLLYNTTDFELEFTKSVTHTCTQIHVYFYFSCLKGY